MYSAHVNGKRLSSVKPHIKLQTDSSQGTKQRHADSPSISGQQGWEQRVPVSPKVSGVPDHSFQQNIPRTEVHLS